MNILTFLCQFYNLQIHLRSELLFLKVVFNVGASKIKVGKGFLISSVVLSN